MIQHDNPLNIKLVFDNLSNSDAFFVENEPDERFDEKTEVIVVEAAHKEMSVLENDDTSNVETPKDESLFDPQKYLTHLAEMFNHKEQYMMEMVEILLQQIPETLQKMEAAIAVENWEEVFAQSHRIKSTFRIAGLKQLVTTCIAIEGRTRIIAPEELYLVPDLFEMFKELSKREVPNLEAALKYLKGNLSLNSEESKNRIGEEDSNEDSDFTFPL